MMGTVNATGQELDFENPIMKALKEDVAKRLKDFDK